jgi:hypothetical protein
MTTPQAQVERHAAASNYDDRSTACVLVRTAAAVGDAQSFLN